MAIINLRSLIGHSMALNPQEGVIVREFLNSLTVPIVLSFEGISVMTWDFMLEMLQDKPNIQFKDSPPNPQYFEKFYQYWYSH